MTNPNNNSRLVALTSPMSIILGIVLLYFGKTLFIPMLFGLLIAMVMYPLCVWLEKKGISRSIAITLCLSIVVLLFAGLIVALIAEVNAFRGDLPQLKSRISESLPQLQQWVQSTFKVPANEQLDWLKKMFSNGEGVGGSLVATLNATASSLFIFLMAPIFAALFLYHRGTFVRAVKAWIGAGYEPEVDKVLSLSINTYSSYIKGMAMVYVIVGVLNSVGLLLLGIKYAILFGMITAVMTIIPYVGIIISAMLPIAIAFITKDSLLYPLGVIAIFSVVQYLEANIIFPKVVGTQLNVSTWATLVGIIVGGILWGMAGMILFIPFVAILKIISDHVPSMRAANLLLNREEGYEG